MASLRRLEARQSSITPKLTFRFGKLTKLPRGYVGPRHVVQIDQPGSDRAYEERPGPGPDPGDDPNTLFVMLVGSPDGIAAPA